jgi:phosphatidyl-myo-inositol dimannoside synthase
MAHGSSKSSYTFAFITVFSEEGGIQSYVRDLLRAYRGLDRPHPPSHCFILRDRPRPPLPAIPPWRFHPCHLSPPWGRLELALRLASHLLWQRPQRVVCGHINLLPLVAPLCQTLGIPYGVLTYGKEAWDSLPPRLQRYLQQADRLGSISRYSRDRTCASNGLDPQRVYLLPCVVDGSVFCPGAPDLQLVRRYGLEGCKVLMTVARLWPGDIYKGVDVTLRALPEILRQEPTVKYLIIGRGDDRPRLEELATTLGIRDRVVFAGFVPSEDLPAHYRLAQGYVMPSQEGFGIVYLEALACGVPVVAGDQDGSGDPLQDGLLGWRVPHRDPQAVAQACLALLAGDDRRTQGDWLRQQTLAHFSLATLAGQLEAFLCGDPQHP